MKKISFILIYLCMSILISNAQSLCGTPCITSSKNLALIEAKNTRSSTNSEYRLRIYFQIVRTSNGTGGKSLLDIMTAFNMLNNDFSVHNISFVWGGYNYIDSDYFYYYPFDSILSYNNHSDGIDIYVFPDNSPESQGKANGVGMSPQLFVSGNWDGVSLLTSPVISHEMGHVLFLWHTHHGTGELGPDNPCTELVNGSNADVCGDYVTDTPADPGLSGNVDPLTGQWIGSGQDANGQPYNPDTRLIMSYTPLQWKQYFSSGQGERMRNAIESLSYLQSTLVPFIVGNTVPCGNSIYKVESIPNGCSVAWSWKNACSVPITQNSPTTNHCTITKNDYQYFRNTLVATISKNGNTITTLEKVIDTGANFSGTFQQAAAPLMNIPATSPTTFHNGEKIMLLLGSNIVLKSPRFIGANISYSGYTPFLWSHNDSTITVKHFSFSNSPQDLLITGTYSENCEAFQFKLRLTEPASIFPQASINITPVGQGYAFELCANMMSDDSPETYSSIKLSGWHMTIANALTGKIMLDEDIEGTQKIVSTTNWEVGIYVVRAQLGEHVVTQKFQISGN